MYLLAVTVIIVVIGTHLFWITNLKLSNYSSQRMSSHCTRSCPYNIIVQSAGDETHLVPRQFNVNSLGTSPHVHGTSTM